MHPLRGTAKRCKNSDLREETACYRCYLTIPALPVSMDANHNLAKSARAYIRWQAKQAVPSRTSSSASSGSIMENKASTADMVKDAIRTLGERGGSSLFNIKKYIETVYQVNMRYRAPRIRKFLREAVDEGGVVQTRGKGASGSFKLPPKKLAKPAAASAAYTAKWTAGGSSSPRPSLSSSSFASASTASSTTSREERAKRRADRQ